MANVKKVVRWVITAVLEVAICLGLVYFGSVCLKSYKGKLEEATRVETPVNEESKVGVIPYYSWHQLKADGSGPDRFNHLYSYKAILDKLDGEAPRYLWRGSYHAEIGGYYLYSVPQKFMQKKLEETEYDPETMDSKNDICRSITDLDDSAAALIMKLTDYRKDAKRGHGKSDLYLGLSGRGDDGVTCFNFTDFGSDRGVEEFAEVGISLKCVNVKVETVFLDDYSLSNNRYTAVVSANVICKKNNGTLKDLEWVPAEGEANHVRFLMEFYMSYDHVDSFGFLRVCGADLLVYDYGPISIDEIDYGKQSLDEIMEMKAEEIWKSIKATEWYTQACDFIAKTNEVKSLPA